MSAETPINRRWQSYQNLLDSPLNSDVMLHDDETYSANGVPNVLVSILVASTVILLGTEDRCESAMSR